MYGDKIKHIEETYGHIIDRNGHSELHIFDGVLYAKDRNRFTRAFDRYEKVLKIIDSQPEQLIATHINNNGFVLELKTDDDQIYKIQANGYYKMVKNREEFSRLVEKYNHKLLTIYISGRSPVLIDYGCNHGPQWVTPETYKKSPRKECTKCYRLQCQPYVDDVYTKRKDLLKYFTDPNDAIGLAINSNKEISFTCPDCGEQTNQLMSYISTRGFHCQKCSDGNSMAEVMMRSVLCQLGIKYTMHFTPEWCVFIYNGRQTFGIYDFAIEDKKLIIEMDGGFHYARITSRYGKSFDDSFNRDRVKDILAEDNGYTIVRVDCDYKSGVRRFDYIKDSIIKTLRDYIDVDKIDWYNLPYLNVSPDVYKVAALWNMGACTSDIAIVMQLSVGIVINYLKEATYLKLCNYNQKETRMRGSRRHYKKYDDSSIYSDFYHTYIEDKTQKEIFDNLKDVSYAA